ncbi:YcfL family protein [Paucibacter sp. PLA-PC-4]|uniref:YcfL family protein n=1 Tax=Paucibacter sp. PLA-PC-4 TaxID=2993655 RepID=UPI002248A567|nr:YcfL family protein [Paucibacter sp. PLA-PC-4]MCX2860806.1 YcfL family protein [Paucibacter sp. PLA-PC-4]
MNKMIKTTLSYCFAAAGALTLLLTSPAFAADEDASSPAIAAKMLLRGKPNGIKVSEMRLVRKNDVLVVQADLQNVQNKDRVVFHRFKWLDANGNQVGDGESWKQTPVMGQQIQTIKSVAPHANAVDLRLEMNVEGK